MLQPRFSNRKTFLSLVCFCMLATIFLFSNALKAAESDFLNLNFGIYTAEKPSSLHDAYLPLLNYLEAQMTKELGQQVRVKFRVFQSYDAGRKALVTGYVDFMQLGPASYILAKDENPGVQLIAIEEEEGESTSQGIIFARQDKGIKKLADLKGKSFAFGDPDSTIGRYFAQAQMVDAGILGKDLSRFDFLLRHDKVAEAVIAGEFDAGACKEKVYRKYKDKGLVEIAVFNSVTRPWVAKPKIDAKVLKSLKNSLISIKDKNVLAAIDKKTTGFIKGDDALFSPVRIAMKKSEKFAAGVQTSKK